MNKPTYFAHPTAVIDEGCEIGAGTKIWHFSHIMPNCKIGENCNLGQNVVISPEVVLGKNVKVQNNVSIYTGVICEDDVFLGPSMVFTNVINPRSAVNRKNRYAKTLVKQGATIGANATVVCGVTPYPKSSRRLTRSAPMAPVSLTKLAVAANGPWRDSWRSSTANRST